MPGQRLHGHEFHLIMFSLFLSRLPLFLYSNAGNWIVTEKLKHSLSDCDTREDSPHSRNSRYLLYMYIFVDQILSVEQDSVRSKLDLTGLNLGDGSDGKEEQESQIWC